MAQPAAVGPLLPQSVQEAIQWVKTGQLNAQQIARRMTDQTISREARAIFGDEQVWEALTDYLSIPIQDNQPLAYRNQFSVKHFYREANKFALGILKIEQTKEDVFVQTKIIRKRLKRLKERELLRFSQEIIAAALADNLPGRIKLTLCMGGEVAKTIRTVGFRSLIGAIYENDNSVVECLIRGGIPINDKEELNGMTPLSVAVSSFYRPRPKPDPVHEEELIASAAGRDSPSPPPEEMKEPAPKNSLDVIRTLLSYRADPTIRDNLGNDPLLLTADEGLYDVAQTLIAAHADVNARYQYEITPLMHAAANNRSDLVCLLTASGAEVNAKDSDGRTALMRAAGKEHLDVALALFAVGAHVDDIDNEGVTALMCASINGKYEMAKMLIKYHASVNKANKLGVTPLLYAAAYKHDDIAELLLIKGASVNAKNKNGQTALMQAASKGYSNLAMTLIHYGARVNELDNEDQSALAYAAYKGNLAVARILVCFGASVDKPDNSGNSALSIARERNYVGLVELFEQEQRDQAPD